LLLGGKLALQRYAFIVNGAPAIRNGRFGLFGVGCRKRVEQRLQSVAAFHKHAVLRLFFLPLREFSSRACSQAASFPSSGTLSDSVSRVCSSAWRRRQLLLILARLRFLFVQLVLQGKTLAELIKLALIVFLLVIHGAISS
jgi:hypothetical protein